MFTATRQAAAPLTAPTAARLESPPPPDRCSEPDCGRRPSSASIALTGAQARPAHVVRRRPERLAGLFRRRPPLQTIQAQPSQ